MARKLTQQTIDDTVTSARNVRAGTLSMFEQVMYSMTEKFADGENLEKAREQRDLLTKCYGESLEGQDRMLQKMLEAEMAHQLELEKVGKVTFAQALEVLASTDMSSYGGLYDAIPWAQLEAFSKTVDASK